MVREVSSLTAIHNVAALAPQSVVTTSTNFNGADHRLDVPKYLQAKGLKLKEQEVADNGYMKFILTECPFNPEHKSKDAMVTQNDNGALGFKCLHDSCSGNHWAQLKGYLGEPDAEDWSPPKYEVDLSNFTTAIGPSDNQPPTVSGLDFWVPQTIGNIDEPPAENEPVIDGMLRRAEVGSIIAVPKAAKSWMMLQLGFSVIEGKPWLERDTTEGHVLLVDNELRPNTIRNRASRVARAVGASQAAIDERFSFVPLRGVEFNFMHIERQLERILTDQHTLVVFDAKYRFFAGMDENSNGDNTTFHNTVDRWSQKFNVAIELVHHSSKGNQGGKSITDVGAGGGAQSRAADCHTVLRDHEEEGLFVLESELRTFKKPEPQSVRFSFPIWEVAGDVEPNVKQLQTRSDVQSGKRTKERTTTILQMLRKSPTGTHSENKLSNNHSASVTFQAAIQELSDTGEIVWIDDFKEPRSKNVTGGWKVSGTSNHTTSPPTDTHTPAL